MPTLADALLLSFNIDASGFKQGAAEAEDAVHKTRDQTEHHAKEIEKHNDRLSEAFRKIKVEAGLFFAALMGARGVADFTADMVHSGMALSTLASSLGISAPKLSAFLDAIEVLGGSSEKAGSALSSLRQQYDRLERGLGEDAKWGDIETGGLSALMASAHGDVIEALKLARAGGPTGWHGIYKDNLAAQSTLLHDLGLDTGLRQDISGPQLNKQIDESGLDAFTQRQIDASTKLWEAWSKASDAIKSLTRDALVPVQTALTAILNQFSEWLTSEQVIKGKSEIFDRMHELSEWLKANINWDQIGGWVEKTWKGIERIVAVLMEWRRTAEVLGIVLLSAQLLHLAGVLQTISLILGGVRVGKWVAGAAIANPLTSLVGTATAIAAWAAYSEWADRAAHGGQLSDEWKAAHGGESADVPKAVGDAIKQLQDRISHIESWLKDWIAGPLQRIYDLIPSKKDEGEATGRLRDVPNSWRRQRPDDHGPADRPRQSYPRQDH